MSAKSRLAGGLILLCLAISLLLAVVGCSSNLGSSSSVANRSVPAPQAGLSTSKPAENAETPAADTATVPTNDDEKSSATVTQAENDSTGVPKAASLMTRSFDFGWCTWYAASEFNKIAPSPGCNWSGNANTWVSHADAAGWKTSTNCRDASVNAIAVWDGGGFGHVAIVRGVSSNGINIDEMNWGTPIGGGKTVNFRKVTSASLSYPLQRGKDTIYTFLGYVFPVRKGSPTQTFTITPSAGSHGSISPSDKQKVNSGDRPTFTAHPAKKYKVDVWELDGKTKQKGGNTYTLPAVTANHKVKVTFKK